MNNKYLFFICFFVYSANINASEWQKLNEYIDGATKFNANESKERFQQLAEQKNTDRNISFDEQKELITLNSKIKNQMALFIGQIESTVVAQFRDAIQNKQLSTVEKHLNTNLTFSKVSEIQSVFLNTINGIKYGESSQFTIKNASSSQFIKDFNSYLQNFKKIDYVDFRIVNIINGNNNSADKIQAVGKIDIRGLNKNNKGRADKIETNLTFDVKGDVAKIREFAIVTALTSHIERSPAFLNTASNSGFNSGKTYQRLEALRRGGYGLATEDFDNDGELDAFVGNYGNSTLWKSKNGTYSKVSAPEIEKITLAKAAAFADFDNDGWKDLFITRFAADKLVGDVLVFKNIKGQFTEVKNAFPSQILRDYAMPAAIADFNNDGLLDVYVGFPGSKDFSAGASTPTPLGVHGLFINKGKFQFQDKTQNISNYKSSVMPHGAIASDFDLDGNVDLLLMDDQTNLSPIYKNNGKGQLNLNNSQMQIANHAYGMGIATGDFNQDGLPDYVISNATFSAQNRLEHIYNRRALSDQKAMNDGIRLFMNSGNGRFSEATSVSGLNDPGEAAGGVTVIDYDNDGLQDIYLVNGLWSGSDRNSTIDSLFAVGTVNNVVMQDHLQDGMGDSTPRGTRSLYMRALLEAKTRNGKTYSFAGYQRNRLFKNLGNGKFLEVGYLEGVDSMADGYMSAIADINRDGKADLVLRNCDPGALDNTFAPVEIFQNRHANTSAVWISLKGKKSNSLGVGAKLFATINGKNHYREMIANNSAMQGEIASHFGLGTARKIDKLVVKWPSGITNTYTDLASGRHTLEEQAESIATN